MTDIKCKKCGSNKHVKNGNVGAISMLRTAMCEESSDIYAKSAGVIL
jgi:hypothetical protein